MNSQIRIWIQMSMVPLPLVRGFAQPDILTRCVASPKMCPLTGQLTPPLCRGRRPGVQALRGDSEPETTKVDAIDGAQVNHRGGWKVCHSQHRLQQHATHIKSDSHVHF